MNDFSNYFSESMSDDDFGGRVHRSRRRPAVRRSKAKAKAKPRTVNLRRIKSPALKKALKKRMITFSGGDSFGGDSFGGDSFIGGEYFDSGYFGGKARGKSSGSKMGVKRKPNKYNMFVKKVMPMIIAKHPRMSQQDRMRKIAKLWASHKRR